MGTTVRIIAEVELKVDTWDSKETFEGLAKRSAREGLQKLNGLSDDLHVVAVKEIKFVTHSIPWDKP